jgi:hypothetical protein
MLISLGWFWRHGWINLGPRRRAAPARPFAVGPGDLPGYDGQGPPGL